MFPKNIKNTLEEAIYSITLQAEHQHTIQGNLFCHNIQYMLLLIQEI